MSISIWTREEVAAHNRTAAGVYCAMYSAEWDAIVTDPGCMRVRVDDHLVHRGDGVFETLLCEEGAIYNMGAHLDRLERSAGFIGIDLPVSRARLEEAAVEVFRVAGRRRALARLLVGRGAGGFSVDPAEPARASLYVVVYDAPAPFMERTPEGARAVLSRIPPKPAGLATVKTCNYLPNAMMKAEASRAGAHFALGVDTEGFLTESFTENLAVVDEAGRLVPLPPTHHLPGTTLDRVAALARERGMEVAPRALRPRDLFRMREVWLVGTTAYVTRVVSLDGTPLSTGPLAEALGEALRRDIAGNGEFRTPVFG